MTPRVRKKCFVAVLAAVILVAGYLVYTRAPGAARSLRWKKVAEGRPNGAIDANDVPELIVQLSYLAPNAFSFDLEPKFYFNWTTADGPRVVLGGIRLVNQDAPEKAMRFTGERLAGQRMWLRLCTFTGTGDFVSLVDIPLGQQSRLARVQLLEERPPGSGCLQVETISTLLGSRFRQYLTPVGSHWGLLRLTSVDVAKGKTNAQANPYAPTAHSMAPPRSFTSIDELVTALRSTDVRSTLAALHWLVGMHENRQYKSRGSDADFANRARADATVLKALQELQQHDDPWVAEALALRRF